MVILDLIITFQENVDTASKVNSINNLFTQESFSTLVGLTGMVYVAANSIQKAFNYNPKWLALLIAEILSIIAVHITSKDPTLISYVISIFNGFLVYLTAAGATDAGDSINKLNIKKNKENKPPERMKKVSNSGRVKYDKIEIETFQKVNNRKFSTSWWR